MHACASCSVMSDSLQPHGLQPARLLCPWDSPNKNTGVDCHSLLQRVFPTQGSNLGLLHRRQFLYHEFFINFFSHFGYYRTLSTVPCAWAAPCVFVHAQSLSRVWLFDILWTGSAVHGIFKARKLEWVAISFSRRSFQPRDWTHTSSI